MLKHTMLIAAICLQYGIAAFAGNVTIQGTIANPLADSITFRFYDYKGNWLDYKSEVVTGKLDKDNKFSVSLDVPHDFTHVDILHGNEGTELYVAPGDKLKMSVDAESFDGTLKYEGSSAAVGNFMAKHMVAYSFTQNFYSVANRITGLEPKQFVDSLNYFIGREQQFLVDNAKQQVYQGRFS